MWWIVRTVLIVTALVCLRYASTVKSGNLEHQNADRAKPCKAERTPAKLAEKPLEVPEVGVGETRSCIAMHPESRAGNGSGRSPEGAASSGSLLLPRYVTGWESSIFFPAPRKRRVEGDTKDLLLLSPMAAALPLVFAVGLLNAVKPPKATFRM